MQDAKKSLMWCLRQSKGIRLVKPSENLARAYLEKSRNAVKRIEQSAFEHVMSMGDDLGNYVDKWIAVREDEIVAVSDNIKEVIKIVKEKYPKETPFIMKVPADRVMVL